MPSHFPGHGSHPRDHTDPSTPAGPLGPTATTSVVIVGAGPAGLTVGALLREAGVDCVVLETENREFIERHPRAGFIEEGAVRALRRRGLAGQLLARAEQHRDCEFRLDGTRHLVRYAELTGHRHYVYPQQLLVTDLLRAYADQAGGDIRFGVADLALHDISTDHPRVTYTDRATGEPHTIACDFVAGCDGARSVTRQFVPEGGLHLLRHDLDVSWLALLADAPPSQDRVVFGLHPHGFAGHMSRGPRLTRYYLECPRDAVASAAEWPHERVWSELRQRLGAREAQPLKEGELVERAVLDMHNYVVEPMAYGRLYLAGDAAHLLAPIAAKGLNLAIHDALLLADALCAYYGHGDCAGLAGYSQACLRRVWQYQEFTGWFSELLHGPSSGDRYRAGLAAARLRRLTGSRTAGASFAGLYIGSDADH
jgi:p-hydroxybenzoate 3-monooxygenase